MNIYIATYKRERIEITAPFRREAQTIAAIALGIPTSKELHIHVTRKNKFPIRMNNAQKR